MVSVRPVRNLVVIGLGLIGGSLALAAKRRGLCENVWGVVRREAVGEQAMALGVVDEASTELDTFAERLGDGDVIFIAVPTLTVGKVLTEIQASVADTVTITDGASVKGSVLEDAKRIWGTPPANLVLGHPIAGSEKSGVEASDADLYEHHRVILTPTEETDTTHLARVTELWQGVGAEVLNMNVAEHDEILAATSHLPHVIAYSLVDTLAHDSQNQNIFRYAAGGFRDFTRIASSDATMWRDIMIANQTSILHAIDLFSKNLAVLREAIAEGDAMALTGVFSRAKAARDHFTKMLARRAYVDPVSEATGYKISSCGPLLGQMNVPGDKSISHRAVMLGAIAEGVTEIEGFIESEDGLATIQAFRELGVVIEGPHEGRVVVYGVGAKGLKAPVSPLYLGGSGTTMRLLAGLLCGQHFNATLSADKRLSTKRMLTVIEPLNLMGAKLGAYDDVGHPPLTLLGGQSLTGIRYALPVASGQVKSALLLAGLYAKGTTTIVEPLPARDHTERMLEAFGVEIQRHGGAVSIQGGQTLKSAKLSVPGDFSAALFWVLAAVITPGSHLMLQGVGVNPTRAGAMDALKSLGADITLENTRSLGGEPVADIHVRYRELTGADFSASQLSEFMDEFPTVFVAACVARGITTIHGINTLKVKEHRRLMALVAGLTSLGANIVEDGDSVNIEGGWLRSAEVDCENDVRLTLAFAAAGLACEEAGVLIQRCGPLSVSFPGFAEMAAHVGISLEIFNS